jgi:hypothetical protein
MTSRASGAAGVSGWAYSRNSPNRGRPLSRSAQERLPTRRVVAVDGPHTASALVPIASRPEPGSVSSAVPPTCPSTGSQQSLMVYNGR